MFDHKGFTLIELISIMVIMGVMASVAVKKFDFISGTATERILLEGVKELNVRETFVWTNAKISSTGWTNDADVFTEIDTHLGDDFVWTAGPNPSGGELRFRTTSISLSRVASTSSKMGNWQ